MSDHVYNVECPKCNKVVWVNNGNMDDLTVDDVEAVQCPWCNHEFPVCPEDDTMEFLNGKDCTPRADKGYKSPNEAFRYKSA